MSSTTRQTAIENNANGPASVSADGASVSQHRLSEQIEADRYLTAKAGAAKNHFGLRFTKLESPEAG